MLSRLQCFIHMDFEDGTKWLPFSRRYVEIHFLIWNCFIILFFFKCTLMCFKISKYKSIVLFHHPALRLIARVQTPCTGWRHYMETFSMILFRCEWNPPVTDGFSAQRASDTEVYLLVFGPFCPDLFAHMNYCCVLQHASKDYPLANDKLAVV